MRPRHPVQFQHAEFFGSFDSNDAESASELRQMRDQELKDRVKSQQQAGIPDNKRIHLVFQYLHFHVFNCNFEFCLYDYKSEKDVEGSCRLGTQTDPGLLHLL